jgi:hypothetical protein
LDKRIESAIVALLNGEPDSGIEKTSSRSKYLKGDRRNVVACDEIEEIVFDSRHDPTMVFGRKKNRATRTLEQSEPEQTSIDMIAIPDSFSDHAELPSTSETTRPRIRPPQTESEINGSIGGEKGWADRQDETPEQFAKRLEGQRRAEQREMVRRAARRGVVFGFIVPESIQQPLPSSQKTKSGLATDVSPQ